MSDKAYYEERARFLKHDRDVVAGNLQRADRRIAELEAQLKDRRQLVDSYALEIESILQTIEDAGVERDAAYPPSGHVAELATRYEKLEAEKEDLFLRLMNAEQTIEQMGQRMSKQTNILLRAGLCPNCGSEEREHTGRMAGGSMTTERGQLIEGEEYEMRCPECEATWWEV